MSNKYNVSEHKANIEGAIIQRDKSAHVRDSAQRYNIRTARVSSSKYSLSPNSDNKAFSDRRASVTANVSLAENTEAFQKSSHSFSQSSAPTATAPNSGETQINTGLSDVRESGGKYSFFDSNLSFQRDRLSENSKIFDDLQNRKYSDSKVTSDLHKPYSNGSRYFKNDKEKAHRESFGNRYLVNTSATQKVGDPTASRLDIAGVSSIVTSPIISVAQEDSNGGQVVAKSVKFTDTAIRTAGKVKKTVQKETAKKASKQAAKAAAQKSAQVAAQQAQAAGKAVAKGASKIPLPILIIIIIVVIIMLFLFMLGGLMGGSCSGTAITMQQTEVVLTNPSTKNSTDIVIWCKNAEEKGWGYVYGGFGQLCTMEYLEQQAQMYPGDDEAGGPMLEAGKQWIGKPVADCIGLIKSYMWYNPEKKSVEYGTNNFSDCGANSIWNNVDVSGEIDTMPDTPGLAVWKSGHIGVYIGNGEVIEAMGTEYGVVKTQLENGNWTKWLEIPTIEYKGTATTSTTTE